MGHGQAASGETDWPVDDVEEEEEQRKGPDEDVVVEGQLVAVPVVLREPLVQVVLLSSNVLTVIVIVTVSVRRIIEVEPIGNSHRGFLSM